jgi:hypothetical protein
VEANLHKSQVNAALIAAVKEQVCVSFLKDQTPIICRASERARNPAPMRRAMNVLRELRRQAECNMRLWDTAAKRLQA